MHNHWHRLSLCLVHGNFCRPHGSLNSCTPAMIRGLQKSKRNLQWMIAPIEDRAVPPNRPKTGRKAFSN